MKTEGRHDANFVITCEEKLVSWQFPVFSESYIPCQAT